MAKKTNTTKSTVNDNKKAKPLINAASTSNWVPSSLHFRARDCLVVKVQDDKKIFFKCVVFLEDTQMSVGMIITTFEMHFMFLGEPNIEQFLEKIIFGNIIGKALASLKPKVGICGQDQSIYLIKLDEAGCKFEEVKKTFMAETQAGHSPVAIKVQPYLLSRLSIELNKNLIIEHKETKIDFGTVSLDKKGLLTKIIPIATGTSSAKLGYAVKDSHATMSIDVCMHTIGLLGGPTIMTIRETQSFKINNKLT